MPKKLKSLVALPLLCILFFASCGSQGQNKMTKKMDKSMYESMKASIIQNSELSHADSSNVFDSEDYDPAADTVDNLLVDMGRVYQQDSSLMVKFDIRTPEELNGHDPEDTLIVGKEVFTRNLHDVHESEILNLRYNLDMLRNKKVTEVDAGCQGQQCPVYAHVSKKRQRLYLYLNGEIIDSFKTSTGRAGHRTPDFDTRPDGRMFRKYSSHKYPGGSYNGLGNMPYAVFIKGGYAIHGTTVGSFPMLGKPASHGCIRMHPRNAQIFFNLVNYMGKENTWVVVDDN